MMNSNIKPAAMWPFAIGLLIVIGTHIYMLVAGLPASQMMPHAVLNLVAAVLMIWGWKKR